MGFFSAALVTGLGAWYGGKKQEEATDRANAANLAAQERARQQLQLFFKKAEGAADSGIRAAKMGFEDAQKAIGTIGQAARSRVTRRETARLGAADAGAADRGLYNSTRALNVRRAIGAETDLTLAGIDESVANLSSQIFRERGRTLAQLNMAKMSLYSQVGLQASQLELVNQYQAADVGGAYADAAASIAQLIMMSEDS